MNLFNHLEHDDNLNCKFLDEPFFLVMECVENEAGPGSPYQSTITATHEPEQNMMNDSIKVQQC